jgi:hypothetical protein
MLIIPHLFRQMFPLSLLSFLPVLLLSFQVLYWPGGGGGKSPGEAARSTVVKLDSRKVRQATCRGGRICWSMGNDRENRMTMS